jgi:hypothetical protein
MAEEKGSGGYNKQYQNDVERVPLVGHPTNRLGASTKDQLYVNVIPESVKNEITETKKVWLNKRGGFTADTTVIGAGGAGRAIYYWHQTGKVYTVVANKVYANTTEKKTLNTSTGTCWFTEFKGSSNYLMLGDGVDLYYIDTSDVVTEVTDGDLPSTQVTPVFFDSYIFIIKDGTAQIYNSDVDDATAWDPTNFLSAEQYADNLVALIRQVNYVVAFGRDSTEFFFDAENASGSPLSRQESVSIKIGCAARDSVAQIDRRIVFVGRSQTGEPQVWQFEGLTSSEISNEFVRKILTAEGSSLSTAKAWFCTHRGHTLYVLNLSARTIVYDCNEKMWVDWSINSSGSHAVLPFNYATEGTNNRILVLHSTDGKIYELDPDVHTDDAGAILVKVVTDKVDFNTTAQKFQANLALVCDAQSSGTVTVDWSDDDYGTWSTSRSLDLTARRAYTKSGGVFRRRAYRLLHSANTPFRAESLELEIQRRVH